MYLQKTGGFSGFSGSFFMSLFIHLYIQIFRLFDYLGDSGIEEVMDFTVIYISFRCFLEQKQTDRKFHVWNHPKLRPILLTLPNAGYVPTYPLRERQDYLC